MSRTRRAKKPAASPSCPVKTDAEVIQLWLSDKSPDTQRGYCYDVACLLDFAGKPLSRIKPADLKAFDGFMLKSGLAAATRYRRLASTRALLRFAFRRGYVSHDAGPAPAHPKPSEAVAKRVPSLEKIGISTTKRACYNRARDPNLPPCPVKADDEMIELWLYGKSENTQRAYRHDVRCLLDLAGKSLAGVTLLDLQAFDKSMSASGLAVASRRRKLCGMRSLFEFAFRCGYVPFDAGASLLSLKVPDTLASRILTVEETGRLFRVLENRCRAINLPDGGYSAREMAAAMSVSFNLVRKAAAAQAWPFKTELREVVCQRGRRVYAWETVKSWLSPVVLAPGWFTVEDLARAKHRSESVVRKTAARRCWPYRVEIHKVKTYQMSKVYSSDCAKRLEFLSRALRDYALVNLLYFGGLRVSEALSVKWESFREAGDGGAFISVLGKGSKTRTVRLPAHAWKAIKAIRGDAGPGAVVFWGQHNAGCLRRGSAQQPWTRENVNRFLKTLAREANVSENLSPHWFRHSHATHALDNNAPIHLVKATLGHSSLLSTERYLHANPESGSGEYLPDPTLPAAVGKAWLAAKRAAALPFVLAGQAAG